jgi:hypothetical protein
LKAESRAQIAVLTADASAVLSSIDHELRRWRFTPRDALPAEYPGQSGTETRELLWRGADASCPWTTLLVEDFQNAFETGYVIARALPDCPVVVSRFYAFDVWQFKVYSGRDCLLRVGDDADHELKWLPAPLAADKIPGLTTLLKGGSEFEAFLSDVIAGRPEPTAVERGLSQRPHSLRFSRDGIDGWQYRAWVHADSPLNR